MAPTEEQMARYRATARQRQQHKQERLRQRQQMGLALAKAASEHLKRDFGAEKVVLFGSMLSLERIHDRSDVDLAVWGLDPKTYFRAVGELLALHPDIDVDLIEMETAPLRLRQDIEATGSVL